MTHCLDKEGLSPSTPCRECLHVLSKCWYIAYSGIVWEGEGAKPSESPQEPFGRPTPNRKHPSSLPQAWGWLSKKLGCFWFSFHPGKHCVPGSVFQVVPNKSVKRKKKRKKKNASMALWSEPFVILSRAMPRRTRLLRQFQGRSPPYSPPRASTTLLLLCFVSS